MTGNYFLPMQVVADSPIEALSRMKSLETGQNVLYPPSPNRKSNVAYESCFYIGITLTTLPKASLVIILHAMNNAVQLRHIRHIRVPTPVESATELC